MKNKTSTAETTRNKVGIGKRATIYYRWASGRIEHITGTLLENNEDSDTNSILMRWHDWTRGVTVEQRFTDTEITNLIFHY